MIILVIWFKEDLAPGIVVYSCNARTCEAEAGVSPVPSQPGLYYAGRLCLRKKGK
jgi:hypothetical protein